MLLASQRKEEKERANRYTSVMRSLVWRYVSAMHRKFEDSPVTEDDINEVKMEVSAMRYELLEVFEKNGMDVSCANRKEDKSECHVSRARPPLMSAFIFITAVLAKKMKVWERRLMKDFHVSVVDIPDVDATNPNYGETALERFRRVSRLVASKSANIKWNEVIKGASIEAYSQIGRCRNRQSFKNQQNLMKAMEQARKLIEQSPSTPMSPTPSHSPNLGYVDETSRTLVELLKNISDEINEISPINTLRVNKQGSRAVSPLQSLNVQLQTLISKTPSPHQTTSKAKKRSTDLSPLRPLSAEGTLSPPPKPQPILKNRSPTPDSSKSLDVPTIEIEHATQSTANEEQEISPLKQGAGSPIKVIKRKAPKPSEDIAVSRPAAPKIPTVQGMIPPPPGKEEAKPMQIPILSTTPATPLLPLKPFSIATETTFKNEEPVKPQIEHEREVIPEPNKEETIAEPPAEPSSAVMIAVSSSSPTSCSSTEKLMTCDDIVVESKPANSPVCLRAGNKIEDVKTIKRQTKAGWL